MNVQFGLDQIASSFVGLVNLDRVTGPGVWIGEMSITGVVPDVTSSDTASNYSF
jgi:hypothetical protein